MIKIPYNIHINFDELNKNKNELSKKYYILQNHIYLINARQTAINSISSKREINKIVERILDEKDSLLMDNI